jgi:hypothetical protein
LFDPTNSMSFLILLEYKSEYSNIKYKRVYKLEATPDLENSTHELKENDWKGRIYFYSSSLVLTTDSDSLTVKEILQNKWFNFSRWSKLKKDYSYEEWLINL